MMTRSIESTVTFLHPFRLPGMVAPQPPGTYALTTDEEELHGVSFITFRTIAIFLRLPALGTATLEIRDVPILLDDLDASLQTDRAVQPSCALNAPA
jgi:hypothetical protein